MHAAADLPSRFACRLYGIAPDWADTDPLMRIVQAAIGGGMQALQWRPKRLAHADNLAQGRQLAALCKAQGVRFIVNDSVEHALLLDADGVHLGRDDGDWREARAALDAAHTGKPGSRKLLGCSCYNDLALAREALEAGADYIALGAVYPSRVKPQAVRVTPQHLRKAVRLIQQHALKNQSDTRAALVAIGGITPISVHKPMDAGADSLAVMSALFGQQVEDIEFDCIHTFIMARTFIRILDERTEPIPGRMSERSNPARTPLPLPHQILMRTSTLNTTSTATSTNAALFERACQTIPGGVNSPVRAFRAVGGTPRFIARAQGPYVWDAENTRYIDYVGSWGPAILGHAHPDVVRAVCEAAPHGLSFGAPCEAEIEIAEILCARLPALEKVRLVSSGTEATMTAIRLARGFTGRNTLIKFEGCYHGHADSLLVKAGSGLLTLGKPTSAGVPAAFTQHTQVLDYNDLDGVRQAFAQCGDDIACVIVEPIAGNMNLVKPVAGFLQGLRDLCTQYGALLIFDEVMTGFRVGPQGVQGAIGVTPDLTTLAKVIGGGMPVGALGGRADIMDALAPLGDVYQAGTLSGNPVAMAAGLATLKLLAEPDFYPRLARQTRKLVDGLTERARAAHVPFCADAEGGMFGLYFLPDIPTRFEQVCGADMARFKRFFHAMLARGVYFAPSAFEAGFVSCMHDDAVIQATLDAAHEVFKALRDE